MSKKDESPKKKKFNTRISPRSSIQQAKKVKQQSTSPRFMNQNLNSSKFAPTDVMSDDLPLDEEEGDEMYTIHQHSNSRLENVYTTSENGRNQDQSIGISARVSIASKTKEVSRAGGYGKVIQLVKRPQVLEGKSHKRHTSEFKDYLAKNMPLATPARTGSHSPVNLSGQYATLQANNPFSEDGNSQTHLAAQNNQFQYPEAPLGISGGQGVVEKENVFSDVFADILRLNS